MKIIVQKFGGTSLESASGRDAAASRVKKRIAEGYSPVVVVSAMGRRGQPYATDTLIDMARKVNMELPAREKDLLMSVGEVISAVVTAQTLRREKLEAEAITGAQAGIITDDNFNNTRILQLRPGKVSQILSRNVIPVIAGFQGVTLEGEITTLGRGGSDTTATAIAGALDAEFVEIFTDVSGIMTADPRKVREARIINRATYNEVCELAHQGAKVIHPRAAEVAMRYDVPIWVLASLGEESGTEIKSISADEEFELRGDKPVTGLASRTDIDFIKVLPRVQQENATGLGSFRILAKNNISVDFINVRPDSITFVVDREMSGLVRELLDQNKYKYDLTNDFCKITAVGGGMTGRPGVMATVVEALMGEAIPIFQTTDSITSISCLIKERDEIRALYALHKAFRLGE
ncbi:MAG: aspartate kinase [Halanaerobium sp.]|nr:aspartate kinase [Halanaerobium sp.]